MADKIAFVLNERGSLVPIMLAIETRDDTDYILEKELIFLTNLEFPCAEADSFGKGVSVGYAVRTMDDVKAEKQPHRELTEEELRDAQPRG